MTTPSPTGGAPDFIDVVPIPGSGAYAGKQLSLQVSCELMKNQLPATPVSPDGDIAVVQDAAGQPMIFAIGNDRSFHLLRFDAGSATGWDLIDLGRSFPGYATAATFDVSQDLKGNITVVAALAKPNGTTTDLFIASMISNGPQTDWSQLGKQAKQVTGVDARFAATKIELGTSDDGSPAFVICAGALAGQQIYYQFDGSGAAAERLEFPENLGSDPSNLEDVAIGYAFGQRGVYFLYKTGDGQTLECTTLATPDQGSLHYDYSAGDAKLPPGLNALRYNCIATPTGSKSDPFSICSDLFVGTDGGVYVFPNANVAGLQKVADSIGDVHQLIVTQDHQNISVWAMCSPNLLYYIAGKKGATYSWNQPILFSSSTIHVAPIRNKQRAANELVLVDQDEQVHHYWQDPGTTAWQQRVLSVKGGAYLFEVTSFTSQIHLENPDGTPVTGQAVKVTSSEWSYVTANGKVYSLDHDNPAVIPTDLQGNVTIIALTSDISSPILHIESDIFAQTVNVYPNGKVNQGLTAIQSGADLTNAKTPDGKPVVDPSVSGDTADGVAANVTQLTAAGSKLQVGTRPAGTTFVSVEAAGVKHNGVLDVSHIPNGTAVGMVLQNGAWQPHPAPVQSLARVMSVGSVIEDIAGDVLHFLEEAFSDAISAVEKGVVILKDGASFVIQKLEDGLSLVLTLADKVFKIALKTLAVVFKALNWVLKLIGIDLMKILAWLGHLLGWDDIWDTHKKLAAIMTNGLNTFVDRAGTEIDSWRATASQMFDDADQQVRNLILPADAPQSSANTQASALRSSNPAASFNRPQNNMTLYQMQHGGMLQGSSALTIATDPIKQFANDVVIPTFNSLATELEKDIADLKALVTDPSHTFDNLRVLLVDLVETVLEPMKALVDGALKLLEDVLRDMRNALAGEFQLPFISSFYEFITDLLGDEEDFTFINGIALLLAIPITEISKATIGHPPFDGADGVDDPSFFQTAAPPAAQPQPVRRALAAVAAAPSAERAMAPQAVMAAVPPGSGGDGGNGDSLLARELSKNQKGYVKAGGIIYPIAIFIADVMAFFSAASEGEGEGGGGGGDGGGGEGGGGQAGMFDKIQAVLALAALAMAWPMEVKNHHDSGLRAKRAAWFILVANNALLWRLPGAEVKGGWFTFCSLGALISAAIGDGEGGEGWQAWIPDIVTNVGGMITGVAAIAKQPEVVVAGLGVIFLGDAAGLVAGIAAAAGD
jgi:hypothetical protein